jgi:hypothetical protein
VGAAVVLVLDVLEVPEEVALVADPVLAPDPVVDPVGVATGRPVSHAAVTVSASAVRPTRAMRAWRAGCAVTHGTYPAAVAPTKPGPGRR